jgi:hypothetical protein
MQPISKNSPEYIQKPLAMEEEEKFNDFLKLYVTRKLYDFPKLDAEEKEYVQKNDALWEDYALKLREITMALNDLEEEKEYIRLKLIEMSDMQNCNGCGITTCRITKKGSINYSDIPELKEVDLEKYRKPSSQYWKIAIL